MKALNPEKNIFQIKNILYVSKLFIFAFLDFLLIFLYLYNKHVNTYSELVLNNL